MRSRVGVPSMPVASPDGHAATLARVLSSTASRVRVRRGVHALPPGAIGGGVVALVLLALAKCSLVPLWLAWTAPATVALGAAITFVIAWSRAISNEEMA